jgi:hypothetical protein
MLISKGQVEKSIIAIDVRFRIVFAAVSESKPFNRLISRRATDGHCQQFTNPSTGPHDIYIFS